jgi:S-adenosylmethionine hydrolase
VGAPVTFEIPEPKVQYDGTIKGHVIHIDFFGNIITNITEEMLAASSNWTFEIGGLEVRTFRTAYAYAREGQIFALIGSQGFLEIAIRNGNAAQRLGVRRNNPVVARPVR